MHHLPGSEVKALDQPVIAAAPVVVDTIDNHIYFVADVSAQHCLTLMQNLRSLDVRLQTEANQRGTPPPPIWLHLNSFGGDLFSGFAVADALQQTKTPVFSIVEGVCASAATIISISCKRRYMSPNSFFLIHQFWAWFVGTHEEFKDEMELQKRLMKRMVDFYVLHSTTNKKAVRKMLKHDTWLTAEEAVTHGFVDEITYQPTSTKKKGKGKK